MNEPPNTELLVRFERCVPNGLRLLAQKYPDHPFLRSAMNREYPNHPLPPAPATFNDWVAWLPLERSAARSVAVPRTPAPTYQIEFTATELETGRCNYSCLRRANWRIEVPEDVLQEAVEGDDPRVIINWINENHTDGTELDAETYDYDYDSLGDKQYEFYRIDIPDGDVRRMMAAYYAAAHLPEATVTV